MNPLQADRLVADLRQAAVPQELSDGRVAAMAEVLVPLPFELCERRLQQWALAAPVDADGRRVEKWMSTPDHVLAAVGIGTRARHLIDRALADRAQGRATEVWPSLREDGWELLEPGAEVPRGVGEWCSNLGLPPPAGRRVSLALPGPAAPPAEEAPDEVAGDVVRAIGTDLQRRKSAALRRSFEALQRPPAPAPIDREALPPVLREALAAADAVQESWAREKARLGAEVRAYEEMRAELADLIRERAPDGETARLVAVELLRRLAADPGYGLIACAEVLRDALCPGAEIALKPEHGPNPDEFDEGPGPLTGLRLALRKC